MNERKSRMDAMLDVLETGRGNAGLMADLRAGLRAETRTRAWPFLARFCDLSDPYRAQVFGTVAGLFAGHPEILVGNSMGRVCRGLCTADERESLADTASLSAELKEGPMSKRMKQLLDSDRDEICERIVRLVLYAENRNIPVDYRMLGCDLLFWGDRVRRRWAQDFWGGPADDPAFAEGEPQ